MMPASPHAPVRWDIFCKVVDNFGDIGVCWRLASQLAAEHGIRLRLWVDDIALARQFCGAGQDGISLLQWTDHADFSQAAEVVIETFGCGLPMAYQQRMLAQHSIWLNVDYLSAERWVDSFHGQPSPQANGLIRYFFYPGFSESTGGLLRERHLPALQSQASWRALGLDAAPGRLNVSLFCYAHAPLSALVDSLQASSQPVRVWVPLTMATAVAKALGRTELQLHDTVQHGQCEFVVIPFLSQTDYDRLLCLCDLNFVRGEDSWIRALWAAKPLIWLPYQQSEDTHLVKLQAFLHHYLLQASPEVAAVIRPAMQAWACGQWHPRDWQTILAILPQWKAHARAYVQTQSEQTDLATKLVNFIEKCHAHRV